jgi:uncharacterized membrane protein YhaH (DUF805 family)
MNLTNAVMKFLLNFPVAVVSCLSKFKSTDGRATRNEFWSFYLFTLIASWTATYVVGSSVAGVLSLILMVPLWATGARRLHDIGLTGWLQLLVFTGVGIIPLIYWYTRASKKEDNQYGAYSEKPVFTPSVKAAKKPVNPPTIIIDNPEVQIVSIKKSGGSDWTLAVCTRSNTNISEMTVVGDGGGNGFVHDETFNYRAHPNN